MSAINYVQSAMSQTTSCAYGSSVTAGNILVMILRNYGSAGFETPSTLTDTVGSTWIQIPFTQVISASNHLSMIVWVAIAAGSGANTVNAGTLTGDTTMVVLEYSVSGGYAITSLAPRIEGTTTNVTVLSEGSFQGNSANQYGAGVLVSSGTEYMAITAAYDDFNTDTWTSSTSTIRQQGNASDGTSMVVGDADSTVAITPGSEYSTTYNGSNASTFKYGTGILIIAASSSGGGGTTGFCFVG